MLTIAVLVKLDIFHATQRITRALPKRHMLYSQILRDIKLLFRDQKDTGQHRTLPTPSAHVLTNQIDMFVTKWKEAEIGGSHILNEKVKKQLEALRSHAFKGCLSDIPVQAGTNRNENLHSFINPYFRRCRMGKPLALALLTILFNHNNQKHSDTVSVLSSKASYLNKHIDKSHNVQFGVIGKTQVISEDSWILAKRGDLHESTSMPNAGKYQITPDLEEYMDIQDILETLQSALNLHQLSNTLCDLSIYSPLLNPKMLPFMSSVSCLFLTVDSDNEQHQQRLNNVVQSWGFQIKHIAGDGNCCFAALAFTLCAQHQQIESALPDDVAIDIHADVTEIAYKLRQLAVNEWMKHPTEYQSFLDGDYTVADEAPQFLQQGYFYGPLGNTMVLAISNALGLPIIVFSSANHYLVINIAPRVCRAPIPLYVAFNQSGAGHYDAVSIPATSMSSNKCAPVKKQQTMFNNTTLFNNTIQVYNFYQMSMSPGKSSVYITV